MSERKEVKKKKSEQRYVLKLIKLMFHTVLVIWKNKHKISHRNSIPR